jgi:hypothetical protein
MGGFADNTARLATIGGAGLRRIDERPRAGFNGGAASRRSRRCARRRNKPPAASVARADSNENHENQPEVADFYRMFLN